MIWLVGAGPGDPGLLTLRGRTLLAAADVVVHDALVSDGVLALARPGARIVSVGKRVRAADDRGGIRTETSREGTAPSQARIHELLAELHAAHPEAVIVRLKGGDPCLFGRGGEEALFLRERGIPCAIVPGISSALAVPELAGIPVTHRGISSSVTVLTGTARPGAPVGVDYSALAALGGTLVVLMGAARAAEIARGLLAAGLDADTSVAAIRWGTWPDEQSWTSTIGELPARLAADPLASPAVLVIGDVVGLAERLAATRSPRVLVTLGEESGRDVAAVLEARGACVDEAPALDYRDLDPGPLDKALRAVAVRDSAWTDLVLSSRRAVSILAARLAALGLDARALAAWTITAIGPGTAAALDRLLKIKADVLAASPRAEGLIAAIGDPGARRFLQPRARNARDLLETALGPALTVLPVYETVEVDWSPPARRVASGAYASVLVGSAAAARVVLQAVSAAGGWPPLTRCIALGPVTAAAAREFGIEVRESASPDPRDLAMAALSLDRATKGF